MVAQGGELCGPRFTYSDLKRIEASQEQQPVDQMLDDLLPLQDNVEFIETYQASLEEANAADEYRKAKKVQASKRAAEARIESARKVVSKVQHLLEEPWKDFVLANEEMTHGGKNCSAPSISLSPLQRALERVRDDSEQGQESSHYRHCRDNQYVLP